MSWCSRWRLVALATLSVLVGCGDGSPAQDEAIEPPRTTTSTATTAGPTIEKDATYGTVEDFRDAVIAAGYECPEYSERDSSTFAAESADCEGDTVLLIYSSATARDNNLETLKALSPPDNALLVGPNWIFNTGQESIIDEIRPELGGVVEHGQRDS